MTAVVLLVGTGASERNPFLPTVVVEIPVNELAAIVRIYPQQREWEALPYPVNGSPDTLLTFPPDTNALRPTTGNIYCSERSQKQAIRTVSTVSHQVYLKVTRSVLFPISEGTNGDSPLEQAPSFRGDKGKIVEAFRRADWLDVCLFALPTRLPRTFLDKVVQVFPRAGFHPRLVVFTLRWVRQHPFRPLPMFKL